MQVFGIDFTSRPSAKKPITCIECTFDGSLLQERGLQEWKDFQKFEEFLKTPGPWIAAIDFPFGQARKFVNNMGWPKTWAGYVRHVEELDREVFRQALEVYRSHRAKGDKEHRRGTDIAAGAVSPQKLYGVPVGLMFFEGAKRLVEAGITVPLLFDGDPLRVVVEAYPGILARKLIDRESYKNDNRKKQDDRQLTARKKLFDAICSDNFRNSNYGFRVKATRSVCDDPSGDRLDALLGAVQAAWAWKNREARFGAPPNVDCLEGWIADPHATTNYHRT